MTAPAYLDYCYGDEVKIDSFCRLPKILVTNEFYCTIPAEIKILYGLMLDRVAMSMRNNWRENGRVFIYFTIREAARLLNVGKDKAVRLFDRMETLGLIRRRKQEAQQPTRIFVQTFVDVPVEDMEEASEDAATDFAEADSVPAETPVTPAQDAAPVTPAQTDAPDAVRDGLSGLLRECAVSVRRLGDLLLGDAAPETRTSSNQTLRQPLSGSLDFPKSVQSYTDKKYTELLDYNQSIHQEGIALYEGETEAAKKEENLELLRGLIGENVDYEGLIRAYSERRNEITGYIEMMAQICCSDRREIRINQQDIPKACVQSRFEKLERKHMVYVLNCMAQIPPKIHNVRAYALSTLYNSYVILQLSPLSYKRRTWAREHYKNWHEPNEYSMFR